MAGTTEDNATLATWGTEIIELLTGQLEFYRRLARLADRQRGLITGNAPEELLAVLGERQRLLERLGAVSGRLRELQPSWPAIRAQLSPQDAERVGVRVSEVNGLLAGILKRDEGDAELLAVRKTETGRAIVAARTQRQAGAAYSANQVPAASGREWTDA